MWINCVIEIKQNQDVTDLEYDLFKEIKQVIVQHFIIIYMEYKIYKYIQF